jgi:hypothetical protein
LTELPTIVPPNQYFPRVEGNLSLESQNLTAYELGYRAQPAERFSYDIALFLNQYENVQALQMGPWTDPDPNGNIFVPLKTSMPRGPSRMARKSRAS